MESLRDEGRIDDYEYGRELYKDLLDKLREIGRIQRAYVKHGGGALPPGPPKGEPIRKPEADLQGYELDYMHAVSAYYGLAAASRREVERLREQLLPDGLLEPGEAPGWITSRASEGGESRLKYLDSEGWIDTVPVHRDSPLGHLERVASRITGKYPWKPAEATHFLLTGEYPTVPPLTGEPGASSITLHVSPYVSTKTVANFYRKLRGGSDNHGSKGAKVLRYVLEESSEITRELRRRFERDHPESRFHSKRDFERAYRAAFKKVIHPLWTLTDWQGLRGKLPGVPPRH